VEDVFAYPNGDGYRIVWNPKHILDYSFRTALLNGDLGQVGSAIRHTAHNVVGNLQFAGNNDHVGLIYQAWTGAPSSPGAHVLPYYISMEDYGFERHTTWDGISGHQLYGDIAWDGEKHAWLYTDDIANGHSLPWPLSVSIFGDDATGLPDLSPTFLPSYLPLDRDLVKISASEVINQPGGGFIVVWESEYASHDEISTALLDISGNLISEINVLPLGNDFKYYGTITPRVDGQGYILAWGYSSQSRQGAGGIKSALLGLDGKLFGEPGVVLDESSTTLRFGGGFENNDERLRISQGGDESIFMVWPTSSLVDIEINGQTYYDRINTIQGLKLDLDFYS
jgi:hypothetical protein